MPIRGLGYGLATVIGFVLALAAVVSVLALGGVETLAFAPAQIAVVILATVVFWREGFPPVSRPTRWVLAVLLAVPILQLIPLPRSVVAAVFPARVYLGDSLLSGLVPLPGNLSLTVNSYGTRLALLNLVCYVLVFLLAFHAYRSRRVPAGLIGVLMTLGVLEAAYGIFQYLTGWQYIFFYRKLLYTQEATGTYVNRNHFAGLLEMVLPFLLAGLVLRRWTQENRGRAVWVQIFVSPWTSRLLRDLVPFALIFVALVFSRSRMGLLAAILGLLVVGAIAFLQTRRLSMLVLLGLVLAVPLAYSVWIGLNPVIERFEVLGQPHALEEDRLPVWRDTVALIRDYPFFGTGLGTYLWANQHYQSSKLYGYYEHAHSDYLEFAADIGIPATVLLFFGLWVLVVKSGSCALLLERSREKILAAGCAGAMAAILVHGITDFNLQIPANAFLFSWIAGTAAGLVAKRNV